MFDYYETELQALRHQAVELARHRPDVARFLNINEMGNADPYIERLLQGTAYLTARVQERFDREIPDALNFLMQCVEPTMVKPYPAVSVVEFQPLGSLSMAGPVTIP